MSHINHYECQEQEKCIAVMSLCFMYPVVLYKTVGAELDARMDKVSFFSFYCDILFNVTTIIRESEDA